MPILPPISGVGAGSVPLVSPLSTSPAAQRVDETAGLDFGKAVVSALENLQTSAAATDRLAEQAATGDLKAIEDYMVMATETQLATQLTVAVRNRAVESFNEIMRMQV